MSIYRKIYYDKASGNVIHQQGYNFHGFTKTTLTQDYQTIKDLNERSFDTIGLLELENDNYDQDFQLCGNFVTVDHVTKELTFIYPNIDPEEPQVPQKALTTQVAELKTENSQLKQRLLQQELDLQDFMDYFVSTIA